MSLSHAKAEWRHGDCQTSFATESDLGQLDPLRQFYATLNRNGKWSAGAIGRYRASDSPVDQMGPLPARLAPCSRAILAVRLFSGSNYLAKGGPRTLRGYLDASGIGGVGFPAGRDGAAQ